MSSRRSTLVGEKAVPLDVLGESEEQLQLGPVLHEAPRAVVDGDGAKGLAVDEVFARDAHFEVPCLEDDFHVLLHRRRRQREPHDDLALTVLARLLPPPRLPIGATLGLARVLRRRRLLVRLRLPPHVRLWPAAPHPAAAQHRLQRGHVHTAGTTITTTTIAQRRHQLLHHRGVRTPSCILGHACLYRLLLDRCVAARDSF
mmetsp:Transcript_30397/g.70678  ORF Transcript_30397/g.70678 Transcript_30397/m.70678 type:complete len:201 (+) Transcript_30397:3-605(+)